MNLVYEPKLYLASQPVGHPDLYKFLDELGAGWRSDCTTTGDELPEVAGRLCYMSFDNPRPGGNAAYIRHIKQVGHGSVLEHSNFGIIFTGVSRSFTHELVRHRVGTAYSQLSQRYVEHDGTFVVPPELKEEVQLAEGFGGFMVGFLQHDFAPELEIFGHYTAKFHPTENPPELWQRLEVGREWIDATHIAQKAYEKKVNDVQNRIYRKLYDKWTDDVSDSMNYPRGVAPYTNDWPKGLKQETKTKVRKAARGAARSLLPNATETKIMVTANARAWRHMVEKRCHPDADVEIRVVFYKVWQLLVQAAPNLFGDYTEVWLDVDGTTALRTEYEGV
jgi:thymidylate synthase (FAD)